MQRWQVLRQRWLPIHQVEVAQAEDSLVEDFQAEVQVVVAEAHGELIAQISVMAVNVLHKVW